MSHQYDGQGRCIQMTPPKSWICIPNSEGKLYTWIHYPVRRWTLERVLEGRSGRNHGGVQRQLGLHELTFISKPGRTVKRLRYCSVEVCLGWFLKIR